MPVPSFAVPSPAVRPRQAHAANENAGDTLEFQSANRGGAGDQNVWTFFTVPHRPASGVHFLLGHWSTMGKDGYTHILRGRFLRLRRPMKPEELHRHKVDWSYSQAMRCRKPNGQKPVTLSAALKHGKQVGFHVIPEPKDPRFALPAVADTFVAVFRKYDTACWPKYLATFPKAREVVQAFGEAGVTCALIGGKKGQARKRALVEQARQQAWPYQPHEW